MTKRHADEVTIEHIIELRKEIERLQEALQHIAELNPLCVGGIKVAIEYARAALKGDE